MIVTVTPNPALDRTYEVDRLDVGETNRAQEPAVRAGGKGVNVTRVLHQQGYASHAVTTTGGTSGERFTAELDAAGITRTLVPTEADTRTSIAIVDRIADATTVLNETGGRLSATELDALVAAVTLATTDASCLVVSGSLPPGAPADLPASLVLVAAEHGIPALVDATGEALLLAASAGAQLLKPNRRELAESTGVDDPLAGAYELIDLGAGLVVVSLGADGMLAVPRDGATLHASLPLTFSGNPTGAGDAAVAALALGLVDGSDGALKDGTWSEEELAELLRLAVAWSAAAVLAPHAGSLGAEEEALTVLAERVRFRALP